MKTIQDENYTVWQNVNSVIEADEVLYEAKQRFKNEERRYHDAVYFYHEKLRELAKQKYKNDDGFSSDITKFIKKHNVPVCEIKKFNDAKVFKYLISNIDKFYKIPPDKKEELKNLKPNTISKLSAVLTASSNDYLFKQIVQNNKKPDYINPVIKPIIKDSYGVIVYEDQTDEIINLILDNDKKEADIFRESLADLSELENLNKVDGSTVLIDYLRQNHCEMYSKMYKAQCDGFVFSAADKGIKEDSAKKLFNLLLAFFISQRYHYKNTEIYNTKQLYAKAYIELNYPKHTA